MTKDKKVLVLLGLLFLTQFVWAQTYSPLYTNSTFTKTINVSLPVGATAGEASVSPTGAALYSIPIVVPPGTNGVTPSVGLTYNSMSGNGFVGMGWSISGLSLISRVPKSIYQDAFAGSVEFTSDDRFALDGVRLVAKSGNYGEDNTIYATESETFARITSYNLGGVVGTGWFKVESKDGTIMEYGNSADSRRQENSSSSALFWLLNKIIYPDGNYIEFKYTSSSDPKITEINYTGNANASLAPYNQIKFDYVSRTTDNNVAYEYGVGVSTAQLLDKITVYTEGAQTVRSYQLNYGFDNINSYLKEIIEKGSDGTSLNSTIFKYGEIANEFEKTTSNAIVGESVILSSGDFDADGYTDLLAITQVVGNNAVEYNSGFKIFKRSATSSSYSKSYEINFPNPVQVVNRENTLKYYTLLASDFTGDGADDVVFSNVTISGSTKTVTDWKIYQSNNATSFTSIDIPVYPNYNQVHSSGKFVYAGDYNGDGIQDLLTMLGWGNNYGVHLYQGGGQLQFGTVGLNGSAILGLSSWVTADQIFILDFNGDGKSDIMLIKDFSCEIFSFDQYVVRRIYSANFPTKNHRIFLGDFNGDRKTDLLVRASLTDNSAAWSKAISTGFNYITSSFTFNQAPKINGSYSDDHLTISDYNGDGKTDIYHGWNYFVNGSANTSRLDMYYSRGTNFYYFQTAYSSLLGFGGSVPFDLNGDGRIDLVNRTDYSLPFDIFSFRKEGKENLLEKVANGTGHITEWNYKRLTEAGSFYTQNGLGTAPFYNIQFPIYAVSEFKPQNGIGGTSSVQYTYAEAKLHKQGKGFLGFKKTTATNVPMGTRTEVENQFNTYPLAVAPYKTSVYLTSNNSLINETTLTNEFVAYGSQFSTDKRFWIRVNSSTENQALEGRTVTTSNSYDSNGNITSSTVNNNSVETTTTTATYGTYATPVPAKPTSVTVTQTRSGQAAYAVTTTYAYNGLGQLTSKTDFSGLPKSVQTSYSYNSLGNVTQVTVSPSGMSTRTSSSTYDTKGRFALTTTNALSQITTATYDPKWGKPLSSVGIDGLTTGYEYDVFGRTKKTNYPEGYSITQTYGWDSNYGAVYYTLIDHPGKPNVKTWYDLVGREKRVETEAFGGGTIVQTKTYDARGNVATSTQPYKTGESVLTTTHTYDSYNRLSSSVTDNSFGTTSMAYVYAGGNLTVTTTNPAGQASSQATDATGKVISSTDNGGTINYTYNSQGNLIATAKDGVTLTSNEFDAYGRQTKLTDQNAGTTTYEYDALGQLTKQTNANGKITNLYYDVAGRTTSREGSEGTTTYEYFDNNSGVAKGKLKKVTAFAGNIEEYTYDFYGRLGSSTETIDGTAHTTNYGYNSYGDLTSKTFPSGFVINQVYDANGYLQYIRNASNSVTLYTNNGLSGLGVNTSYALGNGQSSTTNHHFGIPTQYFTPGVQNLELSWNYASGNLTQRKDNQKGREENFTYDNLNRLTSAQVVGQAALTMTYGNLGNIATKTDVGNYVYHPMKPNAVTNIDNPNGVVSSLLQNIAYTPFAQPATLSENNYELTYTYGSDYERIKSLTKQNGNEINRRYYFGDYEKDLTAGTTKHLHYISSPAGLIAIVVRENGSDTYYYTYTDHLGSILTVTNSGGSVVAEQSFDAWGRYRDPSTWIATTTAPSTGVWAWLTRGYTSHEHLRPFALINMNGRLYDPALGRVLSADNYVVGSSETQAYNRYTYAFNNPLLYNDPDGNCPICGAFLVGALIGAATYTVGVMMSPGGFHTAWSWKSFGKSVLQGGVAGAIGYGIGAAFPISGGGFEATLSNMLANGIAGAGQTALFNNGNIGQGFATGFVMAGISAGIAGASKTALKKNTAVTKQVQLATVADEFDTESVPGIWLDLVVVKATKETTPQIWSYLKFEEWKFHHFNYPKHIGDAVEWMLGDVFVGSMLNVVPVPGIGSSSNYAKRFYQAYPRLAKLYKGTGKLEIHHRIPQRYINSGLFPEEMRASLSNLQGLPTKIHRGMVTPAWNAFSRQNPNATRAQIMKFAIEMDKKIAPYIK